MPDFVTLSCPTCGGKLQITNDIDRFACSHCGTEHVVRRGAGIVSLSPVLDAVRRVETGVDKTASELAIVRLQREIDALENRIHEIRASSPPAKADEVAFALIVFGVFFIIFACLSSNTASLGSFVPGIALIGIGFFLMTYVKSAMNRGRERELRERLKPLSDQVAEKRSEQEKHRQVVSQ
jgi:hypothetical protein